jgi:CheY-like chemotaxis protein
MYSASLAGCSILICEDAPLIALSIADAFTGAGARVLTVRSLADALITVEDEVPSAVIETSHTCSTACSDAVQVPKPANPDVLVTTVLGLLQHRRPTFHLNL